MFSTEVCPCEVELTVQMWAFIVALINSGCPGNVWMRPLLLLPQIPCVLLRAELICGSNESVCIRHL